MKLRLSHNYSRDGADILFCVIYLFKSVLSQFECQTMRLGELFYNMYIYIYIIITAVRNNFLFYSTFISAAIVRNGWL